MLFKEQDVFRSDRYETVDLAIVLGGPEPFLTHRIETAVQLISSSRTPRLLLTGDGRIRHGEVTTEAERMRAFAIEHRVDSAALILEDRSGDTIANARNCNKLLTSSRALQGISSIAIVTSAWHMLRSLMIFRHHIHQSVSLFCQPSADGYNAKTWSENPSAIQLVKMELRYIRQLIDHGYRLP